MAKVSRFTAAALCLLIAVGCSEAPGSAAATPPTAGSTPSPSESSAPDARAIASAAALEAYRGFRRAQVAAEAVADARSPALAIFAGDKALAQERTNLLQLAQAKIVVTGRPTFRPEVVRVSLDGDQVVTITDCVDNGSWSPVFRETGKSAAAPNQSATVLATALARPYRQRWIITELSSDRSRSC